jgi:hypothetical protein
MMPYSQKSQLPDMLATESVPKKIDPKAIQGKISQDQARLCLEHDYIACMASIGLGYK